MPYTTAPTRRLVRGTRDGVPDRALDWYDIGEFE